MNKQILSIPQLRENHILSYFYRVDDRNSEKDYFLAKGVVKSSIFPQSTRDLSFPVMAVGNIQGSVRS